METFAQDVRYAVRQLAKYPGFSVVAILTLALGAGANTAVFSVIHALLLRPLPYHEADRLVRVYAVSEEKGELRGTFSPPDIDDLRRWQSVYQDLAAFEFWPGNSGGTLIGVGQPHYLATTYVSGDFFSTLQATAEKGRVLLPHDDIKGQNLQLVISHGLWERQFGSDPNVIGRAVTADTVTSSRATFTIVGVMPAAFEYPVPQAEAWAPLSLVTDDMVPHRRGIRWLSLIGRLKPGVRIQQAQLETSLKLKQLETAYPVANSGWGSALVLYLRDSIAGDVRPALLVLFGAVSLVLLIACANIANLLLARGTSRAREIAVRSAFGATRVQLVRQLLSESLVLAVFGSAAGLLLAYGMLLVLLAMSAGTIPNPEQVTIDPLVIIFSVGAALLVWPIFGLMPAWKSSSVNMVDALKEGARGTSAGRQHTGMRELLVIGETAIAAVLLVATGLLLNSLWRLTHVDPGFNSQSVLRVHITIPSSVSAQDRDHQYREQMIESVASLPGVIAVGGSKNVPLNGSGEPYEFSLAPFTQRGSIRPGAGAYMVTPGYFEALQIPLKSGRFFTKQDEAGDGRVLVVNESFAKKVWGSEDVVGKVLYVGKMSCDVIGVVSDVHNEGLANKARDTVYMPEKLAPRSSLNLFVRTKSNPLQLVSAIRAAIWSVDKDQAVSDISTMQQIVSQNVAQPRFFTVLLSIFGALAVLLAAIGAYGVISYSVRERTREFGVRIALGADRAQVLALVIQQAMKLIGLGLSAGVLGALATTHLLRNLLFGVKPMDVPTLVVAAILLLGVGLVAAYVPAHSATRIDPLVALRHE